MASFVVYKVQTSINNIQKQQDNVILPNDEEPSVSLDDHLTEFESATLEGIHNLIIASPSKSCMLDLKFLFNECPDELVPLFPEVFNSSFRSSHVYKSFTEADP